MHLISLSATMDFSTINSIMSTVSLVITLLAAVFGIVCGIVGWKRGLNRSLLRLVTVIVTLVAALIITFSLRGTINNSLSFVSDLVIKNLPGDLVNASPSVEALVEQLPGALLSPFVFGIIFFILNIIFFFVYQGVKKISVFKETIIDKKIGDKVSVDKLVATAVSLVGCFVIIVCFTLPISGYVSFADSVVTQIEAERGLDKELYDTVVELDESIIKPMSKNPVFASASALGGKALFNNTSSVTLPAGVVIWEKEAVCIFDTYASAKPLIDNGMDFKHLEKAEADALRNTVSHITDSVIVNSVASEIIPAVADAWTHDHAFMNIDNPTASVPETLKPVTTDILTILATTDANTLKGDLTTITEIIAKLAESGTISAIANDPSASSILDAISTPGLISSIIDTIYDNERTQVLVADIANIGFMAVGESLDIPTDDKAVYSAFVNEIYADINSCESIEDYDDKLEELSSRIEMTFNKYGVDITYAEAILYSECIAQIGPLEGTPEEVVATYFEIISAAIAQANPIEAGEKKSQKEFKDLVVKVVSKYIAEYGAAEFGTTMDVTSQVAGSKKLKHNTVTIEAMLITKESISSVTKEEFSKQTKAIENVLITISVVVEASPESGKLVLDITKLDSQVLTDSLRELASTRNNDKENSGKKPHNLADSTTNLMKSALQNSGIDAIAADKLIEHIISPENENNNNSTDDKNAADTLDSVVNLITIIKNESSSKKEFETAVSKLIKNLDPITAEVLSDCVSLRLINRYTNSSVSIGKKHALVNITRAIISNFGVCSEELSSKQLDAETTYLQMLFTLATSTTTVKNMPLFDERGIPSILGMTSDEFVETIRHSVVLSKTVTENKEDMRGYVSGSVAAEDKVLLLKAINNNKEITDDLAATLCYVFGIDA